MELRQLRYFVALAEELHFARAAERLGMEQSPLSRAIRRLEGDLDVRLLERTTRSTRMTWAGQVLLKQARNVIAAVDQIKTSVAAAARGRQGQIRIGLCEATAHSRVAQLLAGFTAEANDVDIRFFDLPLPLQVEWLREDLLDVGFAPSVGPNNYKGMVVEPIWEEPVFAAIPARHRLAKMKTVNLREVAGEPLIFCGADSDANSFPQFEGLNYEVFEGLRIAARVNSVRVLLTLVSAGHGIGFVTAQQLSSALVQDVMLRPLKDSVPTFTTCLIHLEGQPAEPVDRFVNWVHQFSLAEQRSWPPAEIPDPVT